jgi:hypothetical protein
MKILIACESSAAVRDAFIEQGHDAMSCDLLDSVNDGPHYTGDVMDIIYEPWDLLIAHPPCTYLSSSGLHWNHRRPERAVQTEKAIAFARFFIDGCKHIPLRGVENPIGCLSTKVRKPDQIIQPHQFGADASKATCLWLVGLPKLKATQHVEPRMIDGKPRWANQTDSGQNKLAPSPDRWRERSKTYPGIALAMAQQWGTL